MKISKKASIPLEPVKIPKLTEAEEKKVGEAVKAFTRRLRKLGDYIPEQDDPLIRELCRAAVYSLKVEGLLDATIVQGDISGAKDIGELKMHFVDAIRSSLEALAATRKSRKILGEHAEDKLESWLWEIVRGKEAERKMIA